MARLFINREWSEENNKTEEVEQRLEHHSEVEDHLTPDKNQEINGKQNAEQQNNNLDNDVPLQNYELPKEDDN